MKKTNFKRVCGAKLGGVEPVEKSIMDVRIEKAVEKAVFEALKVHGVAGFKKTSLFMSNERTVRSDKLAA